LLPQGIEACFLRRRCAPPVRCWTPCTVPGGGGVQPNQPPTYAPGDPRGLPPLKTLPGPLPELKSLPELK
jgi:hypothetical protein